MPNPSDRARGSLLGLAVGDALGTTLEFRAPGSFTPIHDMVGGGPFALAPGQWTDDTSMALCLAESLIECGRFDARDQMTRYCRWWHDGHLSSIGRCFDIGTTTKAALRRFEETGDPFAGSDDPQTAGNGSLMRLAPIPIFYGSDAREAVAMAARSSRTTHAAPQAVDACRYYAALIVGAVHGQTKETLLSSLFTPVEGLWDEEPLHPLIAAIGRGSFLTKGRPEIAGTGYVVPSLEAALWSFATTDDFRTGALAAANLGDDADTTAAIYGQLAGTYYGEQGIPKEWLEKLTQRELIAEFAESLLRVANGNRASTDTHA